MTLWTGQLYFLQTIPTASLHDEGLLLDAAVRIAKDNQVPYRDFVAIFGPGQYYVVAALFRALGASIAVERGWDVAVRVALSLVVLYIGRELTSPRAALIPFLLSSLMLATANFYGYVVFPAMLFGLLSCAALGAYFRNGTLRNVFLAGALAGLSGLFRQDFGAYAVAAACVTLVAHAIALRMRGQDTGTLGHRRPVFLAALTLGAGASLALIPVLWLALIVPSADLWRDFVAFPVGYRTAFGLPYPTLGPLLTWPPIIQTWYEVGALRFVPFWAQPVVYVVALCYVAISVRRNADGDAQGSVWTLLSLTLTGAAYFTYAANREDGNLHLVPSTVIVILVLAALGYRLAAARQPAQYKMAAAIGTLIVFGPWYLAAPLSSTIGVVQSLPAFAKLACPAQIGLQRAGCAPLFTSQIEAVQFIRQNTESDTAIYVGDTQHDHLIASDALFYFVAERRNATRYDLLSGLAIKAETQSSIVADLIDKNVEWIVLFGGYDTYFEPNLAGNGLGVTVLDTFIQRSYRPVQRFRDYVILQKIAGP